MQKMDASSNSERASEQLKRVADLPAASLVSEEDVKNKVVLPILRALGYDDSDFNYERRTGRGYVDIVVERFPSGIVVEAKAPRTPLDQYKHQLEAYVFHKHGKVDDQLVHRVEGVKTHQAVSFGLIKLKGDGDIEYEGKPMRKVWLKQKGSSI